MTLQLYKITDKNGKYKPSYFLVTLDGIYCQNESLGFFRHPVIKNKKQLQTHFNRMKKEGLTIQFIYNGSEI